jgi:hypothetical protein
VGVPAAEKQAVGTPLEKGLRITQGELLAEIGLEELLVRPLRVAYRRIVDPVGKLPDAVSRIAKIHPDVIQAELGPKGVEDLLHAVGHGSGAVQNHRVLGCAKATVSFGEGGL